MSTFAPISIDLGGTPRSGDGIFKPFGGLDPSDSSKISGAGDGAAMGLIGGALKKAGQIFMETKLGRAISGTFENVKGKITGSRPVTAVRDFFFGETEKEKIARETKEAASKGTLEAGEKSVASESLKDVSATMEKDTAKAGAELSKIPDGWDAPVKGGAKAGAEVATGAGKVAAEGVAKTAGAEVAEGALKTGARVGVIGALGTAAKVGGVAADVAMVAYTGYKVYDYTKHPEKANAVAEERGKNSFLKNTWENIADPVKLSQSVAASVALTGQLAGVYSDTAKTNQENDRLQAALDQKRATLAHQNGDQTKKPFAIMSQSLSIPQNAHEPMGTQSLPAPIRDGAAVNAPSRDHQLA